MRWSALARVSYSHTHFDSEDNVESAVLKIDSLLAEAHQIFNTLENLKITIQDTLLPSSNLSISAKNKLLEKLYNNDAFSHYNNLTSIIQHIYAIRKAISVFRGTPQKPSFSIDKSPCTLR